MARNKGYSLFEVLIAFAIMALVLTVLLPGQTKLLNRVKSSEETILAMDYASSLASIASLTSPEQWQNAEFDYREWRIKQQVSKTSDKLVRMTIRIYSGAGTELAFLESLRQTN